MSTSLCKKAQTSDICFASIIVGAAAGLLAALQAGRASLPAASCCGDAVCPAASSPSAPAHMTLVSPKLAHGTYQAHWRQITVSAMS